VWQGLISKGGIHSSLSWFLIKMKKNKYIRKPLIIGIQVDENVFRFDKKGNLQRYTASGRKRKHWKVNIREYSKKYLKDKCEICGTKKGLTIHHLVPLNVAIILLEENCQTLCFDCHAEIEKDQIFNNL